MEIVPVNWPCPLNEYIVCYAFISCAWLVKGGQTVKGFYTKELKFKEVSHMKVVKISTQDLDLSQQYLVYFLSPDLQILIRICRRREPLVGSQLPS